MNVKTSSAAQSKVDSLAKEVRSFRKRLNQIAKLQLLESLAPEQQQKVQRKMLLETDLSILEPALKNVESRLRDLQLQEDAQDSKPTHMESVKEENSSTGYGDDHETSSRRRGNEQANEASDAVPLNKGPLLPLHVFIPT